MHLQSLFSCWFATTSRLSGSYGPEIIQAMTQWTLYLWICPIQSQCSASVFVQVIFPDMNHEYLLFWCMTSVPVNHWHSTFNFFLLRSRILPREQQRVTRAPILLLSILMPYSLQCIEQMSIVEPAHLLTVCAHSKYLIFHNTKCRLVLKKNHKHTE